RGWLVDSPEPPLRPGLRIRRSLDRCPPARKPDWVGGVRHRPTNRDIRVLPRVRGLRNICRPITPGPRLRQVAGELGVGPARRTDAVLPAPSLSGRQADLTSLVAACSAGHRRVWTRIVWDS